MTMQFVLFKVDFKDSIEIIRTTVEDENHYNHSLPVVLVQCNPLSMKYRRLVA